MLGMPLLVDEGESAPGGGTTTTTTRPLRKGKSEEARSLNIARKNRATATAEFWAARVCSDFLKPQTEGELVLNPI